MAGFAAYASDGLDLKGGVKITSTGLTSAIASGSAYQLGRGFFLAQITIRQIEVDTNNEGYTIDILANSRSASTSWFTIPLGTYGDKAVTGRSADDSASQPGKIMIPFYNPYDKDVKTRTGVVGTVASGIDYSVTIYPAQQAF